MGFNYLWSSRPDEPRRDPPRAEDVSTPRAVRDDGSAYKFVLFLNTVGFWMTVLLFFPELAHGGDPLTAFAGIGLCLGLFVFAWVPALLYFAAAGSRMSGEQKRALGFRALGSFALKCLGFYIFYTYSTSHGYC
jgi:hypothetical protein